MPIFADHRYKGLFLIAIILSLFAAVLHAQPTIWESRGVGGGGALYAPSFSPHRAGELYLNCDMSDVFHSTNFGRRWETVDFRKLQSSVLNKIQYTSDPLVMYASGGGPGGVGKPVRTTDGGSTWAVLSGDPTNGRSYTILAHPQRTNTVIVSSFDKVYFSNDNGAHFTLITTHGTGWHGCHVAGAFFAGDTVIVATAAGLFHSFNSSSANPSFSSFSVGFNAGNERAYSFCGARQNGITRLFCITFDSGSVRAGNLPQLSYKAFSHISSLDLGQSVWTDLTTKIHAGDLLALVDMSPTNSAIAYACGEGGDQFNRRVFVVYKTTDGGTHWTSVFTTHNNGNIGTAWGGYQGDIGWGWWQCPNGMDVSPIQPDCVALSDMGWLHITTNGGTDWFQAYSDSVSTHPAGAQTPKYQSYKSVGLEPTAAYSMLWLDSTHLIASLADVSMLRSSDAGVSWSFNYTGLTAQYINDVSNVIRHPITGMLYAAQGEIVGANGDYTDAYRGQLPGRIASSSDQGQTWLVLKDFGHTVQCITLDPVLPSRMYAALSDTLGGVGGIYVSDNYSAGAGALWTKLPPPPRTEGRAHSIEVLQNGNLLCVFAARDAGGFQFTASSGIFLSTDGGSTWLDRTAAGMRYRCNSISLDPNDATQSTWLASVGTGGSSGQPGLHRTTNRGISWTRVYNQACWSATFHPVQTTTMYVCTEQNGLCHATQAGSAAPVVSPLTQYLFRTPMRVFFNPYDSREIWVMSFGNGMHVGFTGGIPVELSSFTAAPAGRNISLHWRTESETNNRGFIVQRGRDTISGPPGGPKWTSCGFVPGAGTSESLHEYAFIDRDVDRTVTQHYRLEQIDFDGTVSHAPVVVVAAAPVSVFLLEQNFPNPFHASTVIRLRSAGLIGHDSWKGGVVEIRDLLGRELLNIHLDSSSPVPGELIFDGADLPAGAYRCSFFEAGERMQSIMMTKR